MRSACSLHSAYQPWCKACREARKPRPAADCAAASGLDVQGGASWCDAADAVGAAISAVESVCAADTGSPAVDCGPSPVCDGGSVSVDAGGCC
jgi:hypothetical protein